jgi:hypothetical protein
MSTTQFFKFGAVYGFCNALFLQVKARNKNYPEEDDIERRLHAFRYSVLAEICVDPVAINAAITDLKNDIETLYDRD